MKLVFTGGGSGGHLFPFIAVLREIRQTKPEAKDLDVYYFGPKDNFSKSLLRDEGISKMHFIISGKLRRYFDLRNFVDFFKIPIGFFQSLWHLFWLAPDLVFSTGGFGSLPVVFSAKILGIPIFLHEADSIPGLSSRLEASMSKEIFTSFPDTKILSKDKVISVGNPIRKGITGGNKEAAKTDFSLVGDRPIIFIIGGSQGSLAINNLIVDILTDLLEDFEIIHQTGTNNYKEVMLQANFILEDKKLKPYYHCFGFMNETQLSNAYAASDLVVSRAGSGSVFEIAACSKPSILVPLKGSAQGHQLENAYQFQDAGACEVISEENLTPHFVLEKIRFLISRKDLLKTMSQNAYAFSRLKTANIIANYLLDYLYQSLEE